MDNMLRLSQQCFTIGESLKEREACHMLKSRVPPLPIPPVRATYLVQQLVSPKMVNIRSVVIAGLCAISTVAATTIPRDELVPDTSASKDLEARDLDKRDADDVVSALFFLQSTQRICRCG